MSRSTHISRDEMLRLYVTERHTLDEIASMFDCARPRVKTLLKTYNIPIRPQGGGNHRKVVTRTGKFTFDIDLFRSLFAMGYTYVQMSFLMNIKVHPLKNYAKKLGLRRWYTGNPELFSFYSRTARRLTGATYRKFKHILNPLDLPRTQTGINGGYQLDHIRTVRECFDTGVSPEECASPENLRIIQW